MPRHTDDDVLIQLATRIPKRLHQAVRLYCVTNEILLMDFLVEAIEEKLGKRGRRAGRRVSG